MREMVAPFYWAAAGALAGCGLIGLMTIGWPFLLAGAVLALAGLILLRTKGIWTLFVGFGGLPALVFPAAHIQRRQDDAEPVLRANGGRAPWWPVPRSPGRSRARSFRPATTLCSPCSRRSRSSGWPWVACCSAPAAAPLQPGSFVPGVRAKDCSVFVRRSLWYFLTAFLSVERPRVALRMREPITSRPRESMNLS